MLFPPGSVPGGQQLDTAKALILIEFQNDFVTPEGRLYVPNTANIVPHLSQLAAEFRRKGDVIWVKSEYSSPQSVLSQITGTVSVVLQDFIPLFHQDDDEGLTEDDNPYDLPEHTTTAASQSSLPHPDSTQDLEAFLTTAKGDVTSQCCLPGSTGAQLAEQIKEAISEEKDAIITKSSYSALVDTPLLQVLRSKAVTKVYVCGSLSNVSVFATVLDIVSNGMQVVLIEDCLGYRSEGCHQEAMRQMADNLEADGIDRQELLDDLAGLLGDVVNEEDFPTRFNVSLSTPPPGQGDYSIRRQSVNEWVAGLDGVTNPTFQPAHEAEHTSLVDSDSKMSYHESPANSESSKQMLEADDSLELNQTRKRSTSDLAPELEEPDHKSVHKPSTRRTSSDVPMSSVTKLKSQIRPRGSQRRSPGQNTPSPTLNPAEVLPLQTQSTGDLPNTKAMLSSQVVQHIVSPLMSPSTESPEPFLSVPDIRPQAAKQDSGIDIREIEDKATTLPINNSYLIADLLPASDSEGIFAALRTEVIWGQMRHRSGAVPRLVAVQGSGHPSCPTSIPIYRHPADESPPCLAFTPTVNRIREYCERAVGHSLNHALIQLYRDGEDNISEHSDKTLDIVRGSNVVNYSCGAERTMTLRMKKSALPPLTIRETSPSMELLHHQTMSPQHNRTASAPKSPKRSPPDQQPQVRPSIKVPLPHNSLFVLTPQTNTNFLHSIRPDRRMSSLKSATELAYNSERISITFRQIGTFIDWVPASLTVLPSRSGEAQTDSPARVHTTPRRVSLTSGNDTRDHGFGVSEAMVQIIWGQGATCKGPPSLSQGQRVNLVQPPPRPSPAALLETQHILHAMAAENHLSDRPYAYPHVPADLPDSEREDTTILVQQHGPILNHDRDADSHSPSDRDSDRPAVARLETSPNDHDATVVVQHANLTAVSAEVSPLVLPPQIPGGEDEDPARQGKARGGTQVWDWERWYGRGFDVIDLALRDEER